MKKGTHPLDETVLVNDNRWPVGARALVHVCFGKPVNDHRVVRGRFLPLLQAPCSLIVPAAEASCKGNNIALEAKRHFMWRLK
jgi:hypothetical protein